MLARTPLSLPDFEQWITLPRFRECLFWLSLLALVLLRFMLGSDLSVVMRYSPHDDSLYVERAFHLLAGEAFGPYDPRVLIKYPGISLWLAGVRRLGIPYLVSINALYVGAGAYLLLGLRRCGAGRLALLGASALYLFSPMTFGYFWFRVLREPLATGLLVVMFAAIAHILAGAAQGRRGWLHVTVFTVVFAFALFVREEDRLLWLLLALFVAFLAWQIACAGVLRTRAWQVFLGVAIVAPVVAAKAYESTLRSFAERNYGAPIIHDFGEGEYPRLLAAIRSIQSQKDNRLVMVTQEALAKLHIEVPAFGPVIDRLPPPGPETFSCKLQGVCSEWSNGWMPFWIKDAAYEAGLTPNLPAAQNYFRRIREDIEQACAQGRLRCEPKGKGLIPPMELRWTRAYVHEGWRIAKMILRPEPHSIASPPIVYDVPVDLGRIFQTVTMTDHFDTQWQTSVTNRPSTPAYVNPTSGWRIRLVKPYQALAAVLLIFAAALLGYRLWISDRAPVGALAASAAVFGLFSLFRLAILSYVAVFMGPFESRMVLTTYALGVPLALVFIAEFVGIARARTI